MAKKSTFFYVLVSFLLFGVFAIFLPDYVSSPLSIIILAVIFKIAIGTHWKDSFKLSIINYVWILIFSLFVITAEIIMTIQGQETSGKGLIWAFFLIIIGVPLSLIVLNWTGKRKLPYSLLDRIFYKLKGSKKNQFQTRRKSKENIKAQKHGWKKQRKSKKKVYLTRD